jgi:hypothetical protein
MEANASIWGSLIAPFLTVWRIFDAAFRSQGPWDFDGSIPLEPSELEELEKAKLRLAAARERKQDYMDNNSL